MGLQTPTLPWLWFLSWPCPENQCSLISNSWILTFVFERWSFSAEVKERCPFSVWDCPKTVECLAFEEASWIHGQVFIRPASGESNWPILVILFHPHNIPVREVICQNWNVLSRGPSMSQYFVEPPLLACKEWWGLGDHYVCSGFQNLPIPVEYKKKQGLQWEGSP